MFTTPDARPPDAPATSGAQDAQIAHIAQTAPSAALLAAEEALLREAAPGVAVERGELTGPHGVRIHELSCGEGDPLVLVHGRGGAGAQFAPLFAALAAQRRVITLDLPGWGLSDKPRFTGRDIRDALRVWTGGVLDALDALGLEHVDLLGHSMGGLTALSLALDHPDRVASLVLVDSGGLGRTTPFDVRLFFWLMPERLYPRLGQGFMRRILAMDDPRYRAKQADQAEQPEARAALEFAWALACQPEVIASGGRAFNTWVNPLGVTFDLRERLPELQMPTLLIWGERDRVIPYGEALQARRRLAHGRLVAFTACGHSPFAERPADFARVVNVWLNGGGAPSRV